MGKMITEEEFDRIYRFLKSRYGIDMFRKKEIVQGRLENYIQANGYSDYHEYMNAVEMDFTGKLEAELVNILTTNHTFFMREFEHFDFLQRVVLPELRIKEERNKDLCIWCGASSTGQEPYMLAMLLKDFFGLEQGWDTTILATDISTRALEKAQKGEFLCEQISVLPENWQRRYFKKTGAETCILSPEIRNSVLFRYFNLMDPFPFKKRFHVIFLRNVMIYFDEDTKAALLKKMYDFLEPGGYLFIGTTETLDKTRSAFQYVQPSIYRK